MSTTTANLGLFKYNTTTDSALAFNINTALNDNWDKIDSAMGGGGLPDQTGKSGYLLTTNGSEASWGETSEIHCVIETSISGLDWYRVWSDGWCEQGGRYVIGTTGSGTITFLKDFTDTKYNLFLTKSSSDSSTWNVMTYLENNTNDTAIVKANLTGYNLSGYWMACGFTEV